MKALHLRVDASKLLMYLELFSTSCILKHIPHEICLDPVASSSMTSIQVLISHDLRQGQAGSVTRCTSNLLAQYNQDEQELYSMEKILRNMPCSREKEWLLTDLECEKPEVRKFTDCCWEALSWNATTSQHCILYTSDTANTSYRNEGNWNV